MIKTILVLSDGTEIMAGYQQSNALQSVSIDESCNDGEDLTIGSVCSKRIVANIITPKNQLPIEAGEKIIVYEEENHVRRKKGIFNAEKPRKKNSNTTVLEAYDNISLLDKDVTEWFNTLDKFPYGAYDMAKMVCEHCGILLANQSIENGDFQINKIQFERVTARQIIRWIGEICGCFCLADENGDVLYRWYKINNTMIVPNSSEIGVVFLQGGLSYEDYETKKIDRVQIKSAENEVGIVYPNGEYGENSYIVQSNPFLNENYTTVSVAETLYNVLKDISYTPCRVIVPSSFNFDLGDIVIIKDNNGRLINSFVMKKKRNGQKETIECFGNYKRNGAAALYNTSYSSGYAQILKTRSRISKIELNTEDLYTSIKLLAKETNENLESVSAELELKVGIDENDTIVSMLNASAALINIKSNRLTIESDNFSLSYDGKLTAKGATIDGVFENTGSVLGKVRIFDGIVGVYGIKTDYSDNTDQYTQLYPCMVDLYRNNTDGGGNSLVIELGDGVGYIGFASYGVSGTKNCFVLFEGNEVSVSARLKSVPLSVEENATGEYPITYSPVITMQDLIDLGLIFQ